jgi:hypothetical protein
MGDFLLTTNDRVVGARKKIQRLRTNFAFGWTGLVSAALSIGQHLDTALGEDHVTEAALVSALRSFPATNPREMGVKLIGWLIDDRELCFTWWSNSPERVSFPTECIEGTGAPLFKKLSGMVMTPPDLEVPKRALGFASCLMSDEAGFWKNRKEGFGEAYEILCWRDGSFQYVSDVAYTFAQAEFDSLGRLLRTFPVPWAFQYLAVGEYAMLERFEVEKPLQISRTLFAPIIGDTKAERGKHLANLSSGAPLFKTPEWVCMYMAFVHARETPEPVDLEPHVMVADPTKNTPPYPRFQVLLESDSSRVIVGLPPDAYIKERYDYVMTRRNDEKPSDRTWREYQATTDPLHDISLKLQQAHDQFVALDASIGEYLNTAYTLVTSVYEVDQIVVRVVRFKRPIPPEWSITVGDIIHNLRSALDYLVFQLVILETGAAPTSIGNQFPIAHTESTFDSAQDHMLAGVGSKATVLIRSLQPFVTGEGAKSPLRHLREISNQGKHGEVTLVCAGTDQRIPDQTVGGYGGPLLILSTPGPRGNEAPVYGRKIPAGPEPLLERAKKIKLPSRDVGVLMTFEKPAIDFALGASQIILAIGTRVSEIVERVKKEMFGLQSPPPSSTGSR